jgi:flotillin
VGFIIHLSGPNEALIRSGGGNVPKIRVGGRLFVIPIVHRSFRLSLEVMTLQVETPKVYTKEGVAVSVDGVAQVKVARGEEAIRTAAQQFLGKDRTEIARVALQTMEGHQRAILGTLTVEEIYQDRDSFAKLVLEVASPDMANMGLEIVSFTIRDIQDDQGYLEALGVARTSEVKRDAEIGLAEAERDAAIRRAEASRDSGIREAEADRDTQAARFSADARIAESQRDFQVEKAAFDQEVAAREAEARLAGPLQEAKTQQEIRNEEVEIEVVEVRKQTEVQAQEVERKDRELDSTVRRPADAERFRLQTIADGRRGQLVAEAEGESEAIRLRGQAEADATLAQGLAEAEAMRLKAEAWKEYGQAAIVDRLLESLPEVANAVASPLAQTDRIVMIGGGGGGNGGGVGASRLTGDVTRIIAQLPEVVESLTGIDIIGSVKNLRGVVNTDGGSDEAAGEAASPPAPPEPPAAPPAAEGPPAE